MPKFSHEEAEQLMAGADWRHRWEILPGLWTPGLSTTDARYLLDEFGVPADLTGKNCIDIGCWDGAIAFELERRGGNVLATDIQEPTSTAFSTAHRILDSKVEYLQASVYDLPKLITQKFDVVVFRAVYYHLKNPLGAFEAISLLCNAGSLLCTEGEALRYYAETLDGKPRYDEFLKVAADSDIPLMLYYPGTYMSGENWNVPNMACFKGWMIASGFDIAKSRIWEDRELNGQRLIVSAVRNSKEILIEHSVLPKGWRANARGEVVKGIFIKEERLEAIPAQDAKKD